jgi:hypothetical protein
MTRGKDTLCLEENQSTFIPVGTRHRLENVGEEPLLIIEVQSGSYLGEDHRALRGPLQPQVKAGIDPVIPDRDHSERFPVRTRGHGEHAGHSDENVHEWRLSQATMAIRCIVTPIPGGVNQRRAEVEVKDVVSPADIQKRLRQLDCARAACPAARDSHPVDASKCRILIAAATRATRRWRDVLPRQAGPMSKQ